MLWKIRIRWTQKIAVGCSLCLTVVMITLTIIRASGLRYGNTIDSVWEVYWQIMSAEYVLSRTRSITDL